jgi:hypothetical protein
MGAYYIFTDGHEYFDRDRDLELRPSFEQRKKQLLEKENKGPVGR